MSTIAAVATAHGRGAIGIVRMSGSKSHEYLSSVFSPLSAQFTDFKPWVLHRGRFVAQDGSFLDDVLAVFMPAPHTYTGEDMAEIQCHGSPLICETILDRLFQLGASPAQHGEFSKRAYLNGRMDLSQAEAVVELVQAASVEALKESVQRLDGLLTKKIDSLRKQLDALRAQVIVACDFPEEEHECIAKNVFLERICDLESGIAYLLQGKERSRFFQEGAKVVLVGSVNAGKSSLLNALLGRERALVTAIEGTTRDYLEESCLLDGLPVRLIDTAGIRNTNDPIEQMGIDRGLSCLDSADLVLVVMDGLKWNLEMLAEDSCSSAEYSKLLEACSLLPTILVWNKVDCVRPAFFPPKWFTQNALCVSCETGEGLCELTKMIRSVLVGDRYCQRSSEYVGVNLRQARALSAAQKELLDLRNDVENDVPYDLCCVRLDMVAHILGEVIGESTSSDVLHDIFDRFCIGK